MITEEWRKGPEDKNYHTTWISGWQCDNCGRPVEPVKWEESKTGDIPE